MRSASASSTSRTTVSTASVSVSVEYSSHEYLLLGIISLRQTVRINFLRGPSSIRAKSRIRLLTGFTDIVSPPASTRWGLAHTLCTPPPLVPVGVYSILSRVDTYLPPVGCFDSPNLVPQSNASHL